jgi:hypothetical protein
MPGHDSVHRLSHSHRACSHGDNEASQYGETSVPTPPRRRPPTIDLKATEVVSASAAEAGADPLPGPLSGTDPPPADPAANAHIGTEADEGADMAASVEAGSERRARPGVRPAVVIGAGIAGASIAAVAGALIWGLGLLPPSIRLANDEAIAPVVARVAALEHQLAELEARPAAASSSEFQESQARLTKLEDEIGRQHDATEARLATLEAAPAAPNPAPQLADLQSRIAKLEAKAAAPPAAADQAQLDRLSALDRRVDQAASTARDAANRAAAAEQAVRANGGAEEGLAKLQSGLDRLAARVNSLDGLAARVGALESSSKGIEQRLAKMATAAASDRALGLGLATIDLRMAVERGTPFVDELAAVKQLEPDPALVAPLEALAPTGIPSVAALSRDLAKLEPTILQATQDTDHEGSVLARLEARASRLVRIRPVDAAPGTDPETVLVRAEAAAGRGDISGAVAELDHLPENLRASAAGWINAARARVAALDAARRLSASALAALTKPTP